MARIDGSSRGVLITEESARRIARAIQKLEQGNRSVDGRKLRVGYDEGENVRIALTLENWDVNTVAEIDRIKVNHCDLGAEGSGGNDTMEAINELFPVRQGTKVVVALAENGCWYLIAAGQECRGGDGFGDRCCVSIGGQDLTKIENFDPDASGQILGHREGCLYWYDTDECEGSGS
jgi:hypothetical protein